MPIVGIAHTDLLARPWTVHDGVCFSIEVRTMVPRSREANLRSIHAMLHDRTADAARPTQTASTDASRNAVVLLWSTLTTDPIASYDRPHTVHTQPSFAQMHADLQPVANAQAVDWYTRRAAAFVDQESTLALSRAAVEVTPPQQFAEPLDAEAIEAAKRERERRKLPVHTRRKLTRSLAALDEMARLLDA